MTSSRETTQFDDRNGQVVQRIPLRVDTTHADLPPLRADMSAEVEVDTGHRRGLPHFLTALFVHAGRVQ